MRIRATSSQSCGSIVIESPPRALQAQRRRGDVDPLQRKVPDRRHRLRRHLQPIKTRRRLRKNKKNPILLPRRVMKNRRVVQNPLVAVVQDLPKNQRPDVRARPVLPHGLKKPVTIRTVTVGAVTVTQNPFSALNV
jgi:hypothetical protein